jgi:hypothetical protein
MDGNRAVRIDPDTESVDLIVELPDGCRPYTVSVLQVVQTGWQVSKIWFGSRLCASWLDATCCAYVLLAL